MTPPLPPIPTPPAVRWREFRHRAVPLLVFACGGVLAAALWFRTVAPAHFPAEAESVVAEVTAGQTGFLTDLHADVLQPVVAGETVAHLHTADPRVAAAKLAVIRAELERLRVGLTPQQRLALDHRRLQLDWMKERVTLASLRSKLELAEADFSRVAQLRQSNIVTDERYENARTLRDGLLARVEAQAKLVQETDPAGGTPDHDWKEPDADAALAAAIKVQEEKLRRAEEQLTPIPLAAPIDGVVKAIFHRNGETVPAGKPVLAIEAEHPARLVGFVRQPLAREPKPGMRVEIRTRALRRETAFSTIDRVGRAFEPIPAALLATTIRAAVPETGLRVHIVPPAGLQLRPGEHVDVILGADGG